MDAIIRNQCVGITSDGIRCINKHQRNSNRCKVHENTLLKHGPHTTELLELGYKQKREIEDLEQRYIIREDQNDNSLRELLWQTIERHIEEKRVIQERHVQEIARTGVNPDAAANERKRVEHERKREAARQIRQQRALERLQAEINADTESDNEEQPKYGELHEIVNDSQNVHRAKVVNMVNKTVETILKVPVPEDFRWNMTTCSKTPGDIVIQCKLTPKGAWQMTSQYCQDNDVYNMGKGIYGKVLDCVWQYILTSKDKDELMKILRQEMEDNIGKCAQGNLTRLCNILSGYMDDIQIKEPVAEVLGRKIPLLFEIENIEERVQTAYKVLVDEGLPQSEWLNWLTPLINDDDDEKWYRIEIVNDTSTGRIQLVEIPRGN